MDNVKKILII